MIVTFVDCGNCDWDAMYIGDQKVLANHSLNPREVAEAIALPEHGDYNGVEIDHYSLSEEEQRYLNDCGDLPDSLAEITSGRWMAAGREFWKKHGEPKRW